MSAISEYLGVTALLGQHNATTATAAALQGKYVLLYFSAHWCPPCRGFTPELAAWYKATKAERDDFEVVFVSGDHNEGEFKEYFETMPWLAIPFSEAGKRSALNAKLGVRGIPTLCVIDKDGKTVITKEARGDVGTDPKGLPWKPQTFDELMASGPIQTKSAATTWAALTAAHDHVAIYFSAHWCGPCRGFTPRLVQAYNSAAANLSGKSSPAIIFASRDKTAAEFAEYYKEMPWAAFPFGDPRTAKLMRTFEVGGIPTLVVIDTKTGKAINTEAEDLVRAEDVAGAGWPYKKQPFPVVCAFEASEKCVGPLQRGEIVALLDVSNINNAEEEASARKSFEAAAATLYTKYSDLVEGDVKVRCMFTTDKSASAQLSAEAVNQCPQQHALTKRTRTNARCDVCGGQVQGDAWNCKECDFDRCEACHESRRAQQPQSLSLLKQIERVTSLGAAAANTASVLMVAGREGRRFEVRASTAASDIATAVEEFIAAVRE